MKNNRYMKGRELLDKATKKTGVVSDMWSNYMDWAKNRKEKSKKKFDKYFKQTGQLPG